MSSLPPSQLYAYENKAALDDLFLNACDSKVVVRKPRIPADLIYQTFQIFLAEASEPLESKDDPRFTWTKIHLEMQALSSMTF